MKLDFSAANEFRRCPERFRRRYIQELDYKGEAPPLTFGRGVHEALGKFHDPRIPVLKAPTNRCKSVGQLIYRESDTILAREALQEEHSDHLNKCKECATLTAFFMVATGEDSRLVDINPQEKRSIQHGFRLLKRYMDINPLKDYETHVGPDGKPYIEIDLAIELSPEVIFTGRVDIIMRKLRDNTLWVVDHKTKFTLKQPFIVATRPNHQLTGYYWGSGVYVEQPMTGIVVNGILVAPKSLEYYPIETRRREDEIQQWMNDHIMAARTIRYLMESAPDGPWPQHSPDACYSFWTECPFKNFCISQPEHWEGIERSNYVKRPWDSFGFLDGIES